MPSTETYTDIYALKRKSHTYLDKYALTRDIYVDIYVYVDLYAYVYLKRVIHP